MTECKELEQRLGEMVPRSEHSAQVDRLEEARARSDREKADLASKCKQLEQQVSDMLTDHMAQVDCLERALAEVKHDRERLTSLSGQLEQRLGEMVPRSEHDEQMDQVDRALEEANLERERLVSECRLLEQRLGDMMPRIEHIEHVGRLERTLSHAVSESNQAIARVGLECKQLEQRLSDMIPREKHDELVLRLEAQLAEAAREKDGLASEYRQLETDREARVGCLERALAEADRERERLSLECEQLKQLLSDTVPKAEYADRTDRLMEALAEAEQVKERLVADCKELEQRLGDMVPADEHREQIDRLAQQQGYADDEIKRLMTECKELEQRLGEMVPRIQHNDVLARLESCLLQMRGLFQHHVDSYLLQTCQEMTGVDFKINQLEDFVSLIEHKLQMEFLQCAVANKYFQSQKFVLECNQLDQILKEMVWKEIHEEKICVLETALKNATATNKTLSEARVKEQTRIAELQTLLDVTLSSKQHEDNEIQRLLAVNAQLQGEVDRIGFQFKGSNFVSTQHEDMIPNCKFDANLGQIFVIMSGFVQEIVDLQLDFAILLCQQHDIEPFITVMKHKIQELKLESESSISPVKHQETIIQFEKKMAEALSLQEERFKNELLLLEKSKEARIAQDEQTISSMKREMNCMQLLLDSILAKKQQTEAELCRLKKENSEMKEMISNMISPEQYLRVSDQVKIMKEKEITHAEFAKTAEKQACEISALNAHMNKSTASHQEEVQTLKDEMNRLHTLLDSVLSKKQEALHQMQNLEQVNKKLAEQLSNSIPQEIHAEELMAITETMSQLKATMVSKERYFHDISMLNTKLADVQLELISIASELSLAETEIDSLKELNCSYSQQSSAVVLRSYFEYICNIHHAELSRLQIETINSIPKSFCQLHLNQVCREIEQVLQTVKAVQKAEDQLLSDFYTLREQVAELQRNEVAATSEASEQEMHALKVLMNGMVERSIYDCTKERLASVEQELMQIRFQESTHKKIKDDQASDISSLKEECERLRVVASNAELKQKEVLTLMEQVETVNSKLQELVVELVPKSKYLEDMSDFQFKLSKLILYKADISRLESEMAQMVSKEDHTLQIGNLKVENQRLKELAIKQETELKSMQCKFEEFASSRSIFGKEMVGQDEITNEPVKSAGRVYERTFRVGPKSVDFGTRFERLSEKSGKKFQDSLGIQADHRWQQSFGTSDPEFSLSTVNVSICNDQLSESLSKQKALITEIKHLQTLLETSKLKELEANAIIDRLELVNFNLQEKIIQMVPKEQYMNEIEVLEKTIADMIPKSVLDSHEKNFERKLQQEMCSQNPIFKAEMRNVKEDFGRNDALVEAFMANQRKSVAEIQRLEALNAKLQEQVASLSQRINHTHKASYDEESAERSPRAHIESDLESFEASSQSQVPDPSFIFI